MKKFKPYIREFAIFLFVFIILAIIIVYGGYVQIIIKPHLISYCILAFIVFSIVFSYRHIIVSGISAVIDFLFKKRTEKRAIFIEVHQSYGSIFSDRFTSESSRSSRCETIYIYVFKEKNTVLLLKSNETLNLIPAQKYHITYGKYSKIILSISNN